jgi:hypothetical protein
LLAVEDSRENYLPTSVGASVCSGKSPPAATAAQPISDRDDDDDGNDRDEDRTRPGRRRNRDAPQFTKSIP